MKNTKNLTLLVLGILLYSCGITPKSKYKKGVKKANYAYFYGFNNNQKELVRRHWDESFADFPGLYHKLYPDTKDGALGDSYFPIFLDSYGGIFPDNLYTEKDSVFFVSKPREHMQRIKKKIKKYKKLEKNSHFRFSQNYNLKKENPEIKGFLSDLDVNSRKDTDFDLLIERNQQILGSNTYKDIKSFYKDWEATYNPRLYSQLKNKLVGKEKVVFFAHGYNVPYSLACIQLNGFVKSLKNKGMDVNKTLFVPIFWPSGSLKKCKIKSDDKFQTKDRTRVKNISNFLYTSNRAYFASITLRKLINAVGEMGDNVPEILMISHSSGNTVTTSSLINTISKLDYTQSDKSLSLWIEGLFKETKLPEVPVRVFMSASAIPGENTFTDISNSSEYANKRFYIGYNFSDNTLKKFIGVRKNLGATTLGNNSFNDIERVYRIFYEKGLTDNLKTREVSTNFNHDVFTYLLKNEYQKLLKDFWNDEIH